MRGGCAGQGELLAPPATGSPGPGGCGHHQPSPHRSGDRPGGLPVLTGGGGGSPSDGTDPARGGVSVPVSCRDQGRKTVPRSGHGHQHSQGSLEHPALQQWDGVQAERAEHQQRGSHSVPSPSLSLQTPLHQHCQEPLGARAQKSPGQVPSHSTYCSPDSDRGNLSLLHSSWSYSAFVFQEKTEGKRRRISSESQSSQITAAKKKKVDCSDIQVNFDISNLPPTEAGDSDSDIDYCVIYK